MYVPHEDLVDDYRAALTAFNKCVQAFNECNYRVRNRQIVHISKLNLANGESHYQYRNALARELELLATYLTVINGLINQGMMATLTDAVISENGELDEITIVIKGE